MYTFFPAFSFFISLYVNPTPPLPLLRGGGGDDDNEQQPYFLYNLLYYLKWYDYSEFFNNKSTRNNFVKQKWITTFYCCNSAVTVIYYSISCIFSKMSWILLTNLNFYYVQNFISYQFHWLFSNFLIFFVWLDRVVHRITTDIAVYYLPSSEYLDISDCCISHN